MKKLPEFLPKEGYQMNAQELWFTDKHILSYTV